MSPVKLDSEQVILDVMLGRTIANLVLYNDGFEVFLHKVIFADGVEIILSGDYEGHTYVYLPDEEGGD